MYVRGTDGAVWGRDHSAAGWNAWRRTGGNVLAGTGPTAAYLDGTYLMVTGADTQLEVYLNIGNWMQYPPTFTGWAKVTG